MRNDTEMWNEMLRNALTSRDEMLKKEDLKIGHWYKGKGRNNHIALWDGHYFLTFGLRFDQWVIKQEAHWDDEGPFQPMEKL